MDFAISAELQIEPRKQLDCECHPKVHNQAGHVSKNDSNVGNGDGIIYPKERGRSLGLAIPARGENALGIANVSACTARKGGI